jgi:2-methylisocitrate lyase-like PEP mutase family enzyme
MVSKIKAAVDSRREDVVVIARTDACAVEGFEAAIERAGRYIDAGADMTFVEAPNSLEELKEIPKAPEGSSTAKRRVGWQDAHRRPQELRRHGIFLRPVRKCSCVYRKPYLS